ncbi:MAG TPA: hypothetical protein VLB83_00760, partial [Candidatus Paceibacterota bacterium]|nr:hypothetical protein [Candidatus Paceibacterota bacterium]
MDAAPLWLWTARLKDVLVCSTSGVAFEAAVLLWRKNVLFWPCYGSRGDRESCNTKPLSVTSESNGGQVGKTLRDRLKVSGASLSVARVRNMHAASSAARSLK